MSEERDTTSAFVLHGIGVHPNLESGSAASILMANQLMENFGRDGSVSINELSEVDPDPEFCGRIANQIHETMARVYSKKLGRRVELPKVTQEAATCMVKSYAKSAIGVIEDVVSGITGRHYEPGELQSVLAEEEELFLKVKDEVGMLLEFGGSSQEHRDAAISDYLAKLDFYSKI